jgi:hypothetical protein
MCLLDGARYWQARGAPSSATILTIWSSGPVHWARRSTIGNAAKLTVTRQTHFNVISCPMAKKLTWQSLPRARIPPRQPVKREAEEDWGKERWQQQSK